MTLILDIIHLATEDGRYLCNQAVTTFPEKMTDDYSKVTCKNCIRIQEKAEVSADLHRKYDLLTSTDENDTTEGELQKSYEDLKKIDNYLDDGYDRQQDDKATEH